MIEELEDTFLVMGKWEPEYPGGWALECFNKDYDSMVLATGTKAEMEEMRNFIIATLEGR